MTGTVKVNVTSFLSNDKAAREQRDKTMDYKVEIDCTSPIVINKIKPFVDYNQWLKRLDTQLNKPTNKKLLKVPKVVKTTE